MTPLELVIAECQSTGDPFVQELAVEAAAELVKLRNALIECADVLGKLMQSARIEGKTEHEKYARHGLETAHAAIAKAQVKEE